MRVIVRVTGWLLFPIYDSYSPIHPHPHIRPQDETRVNRLQPVVFKKLWLNDDFDEK